MLSANAGLKKGQWGLTSTLAVVAAGRVLDLLCDTLVMVRGSSVPPIANFDSFIYILWL